MRALRFAGLDPALLLTITCHVIVRALYADFVPLYDSRQYFDECALPFHEGSWNPLKLNCFGHPSLAFMSVIMLGQTLDFGSTYLLHATTTAMGVASIVAFHRLCGRLLVAPELLWDRRLLVVCYGLGVPCLSGGVNFNPDYGVLVFFVLMLERLLAGGLGLCALWGACLLLSKESGLLLYGTAVGAFVLHAWIRPRTHPPRTELLRKSALLFAPLLVLLLVKVAERASGMPLMWGGDRTSESIVPMFLTFALLHPTFLAYCVDILGFGYTWILGLPLVVYVVASTLRAIVNRPQPPPDGFDRQGVVILLTVFGLSFLLLTRFITFNNVRYFGALHPLVIASAGYALCALGLQPKSRFLVLGLAAALTFSFNFHSLDPVSRGAFGSFPFGKREMLHMSSPDPCCGYGRDQLVYNLEFTALHYLQNEAYRALEPGPHTPLVAADQVEFHFSGRLDSKTFERTLRPHGSHRVRILDASFLVGRKPLPERIVFLVFPNFDNARAYKLLTARYREVGRQVFEHRGYQLLVHVLQRNE